MLGQAMVRTAISNKFEFFTACRNDECSFKLDVLNFHDLEQDFIDFIVSNKIEYVVNCIGVLVDESSKNFRNSIEINGLFPINLAAICSSVNVKLIHISTDCVYSGSSAPIEHSQTPDPKDPYGVSKYIGEFSKDSCMVIRTSIIGEDMSPKPQGLLNWVLSNNNASIHGFTNARWSGVTTDYLAYFLLEKIIRGTKYRNGQYNLATNCISKFDLIQRIIDIYDLQISLKRHELKSPLNKCLLSDFENIPNIHVQLSKEFVG